MQRIIVDFPEPDGPQTTMRSPFFTVRLMFLRTWNWPYHLCTPSRRIITSSEICMATAVLAISLAPLALVARVQLALQILAVSRHAEAERKIPDGDERQR